MRSLLFIAVSCLLGASVSAQSLEIGINGGMSTTLKPGESLYKGEKGVLDYAADINAHYGFADRWEAGISIGLTRWERLDDWKLTGANGFDLGTHEVKYIFAQRAVNFAFRLNHVIPIYQQYEDFVRSKFYVGLSAGAVFTGNDGKVSHDRVNPYTPNEYTYASEFHFEGGYGFTLGAQVGYTYYFNHALGINIDFAPRVAWVKTVDPRYNRANELFSMMYFPTTLGFHVRLGSR